MPEKYAHIDFTPPEGVRKEAKKGLAWRREHGRGGTAVGIARARDLSNGTKLSPSTVRRMKAFFDRHEIDKKGKGWNPGDEGFPSNGRIAWALWGSDAGWAYARKVVEQMNAADEKEGRSLRPFGSTQGIKPKVFVVHGAPASGKTSYVMQHKGDNDVVFDFDKVMSALSGLPPHQKNENLISYCTDIRSLIIKRALRSPKVDRTWIIATNVGDEMKSQLSDIPVEYIHIDTPKEECLKRIEEDPERQPVAKELREAVERYFSPEQRSAAVQPNVERRFLGNFSNVEKSDPDLLRVEKRADPNTGQPQTYLIGYAARFGKESLLLGDFVERIDPAAFDLVEKREDGDGRPLETRCLFNHDPNHLLGRFPTTMKMTVDEKGLRYECLLPESRKDIEELCRRSDLKGSSFSFVVAEGGEKWSYENGRSVRLVTKIKSLLDCGPVTYPAYGDATVAVAKRSYEQHIATKSGHAESRHAIKAKAAEELAKTKAFLAERRGFCPTGEGGGVDNSCGAEGAKGGGSPEKSGGGRLSAAVKGAVAGAVAGGLAGGVAGAAAGAVALGFAAFIASGQKTDEALEKAKSDMGLDDTKLNVAAAALYGKGKPQRITTRVTKDGIISMFAAEGLTYISPRLPDAIGGKNRGSNLHFHPFGGDNVGNDALVAAKAAGVKTVSVQSDSPAHDASLKAAGFKKANAINRKSENHDIWIKDLSKKSKRSIDDLKAFLEERRGFCPTGEGGGIDNSCDPKNGGGKSGGDRPQKPKSDGPITGVSRRPPMTIGAMKALDELFSKKAAGDKPTGGTKSGGDRPQKPKSDGPITEVSRRPPMTIGAMKALDELFSKKAAGDYMEWQKGKDKEAQGFVDKAREGQLARGGKSGGKSDDGGGVQTWSKGDDFPWTAKQVGTDEGYVQGQHPDGSQTEKYPFKGDSSEAYKKVSAEIAKKKNKRAVDIVRETTEFLKARRR